MQRIVPTMLLFLSASACIAQHNGNPAIKSGDVVEAMMPNGVPTGLALPSTSEKTLRVEQLRQAQLKAKGYRAQQVAFLLAVLGVDYPKNRAYLVKALDRCNSKPPRDCDENTAALVIGLFQRGDFSLLEPLLRAGSRSDGALAEILGDFYADTLIQRPKQFLRSISSLPAATQGTVCYLAGGRDGGGMAPQEVERVRNDMKALGDAPAQRCLRAVEQAVRDATE